MRRGLGRAVELGGLAREMARSRTAVAGTAAEARGKVVERLARLHGLPQKIGQILSLSEMETGEQAYTALTETGPEIPPDKALAEIESALGRPLGECFAQIEAHGIGASLSQVHRAVLKDGRPVAVKIQYPGIRKALEFDLKALGWLTAPVGGLRRGFDIAAYRRELALKFTEELDYRQEAAMLTRFRTAASMFSEIEIPEVIEELSGDRVLTMTWLEGKPISAVRSWPASARREVAISLLRFFLTSCFSWGLVHADPHAGNYRFRREGRPMIGLLDFGCVKALDGRAIGALRGLIDATLSGTLKADSSLARAYYEALGFNPLLLAPMEQKLAFLSEILFEPFCIDRPFDPRGWHLGERVENLLGELRWNFRVAGPADLIFFMRAYQGLIQYLKMLDAPVNWQELYLAINRPIAATAPQPVAATPAGNVKSRNLRIRVEEHGRLKAEVTFAAAAAANLPELIPEEIEPKLAARGIDLSEVTGELVKSDFAPGEIFKLEEESKSFRVWLE